MESKDALKCDNPNCDYVNSNIPFEQYEQFIDYPCPKCGYPLLTFEKYKLFCSMENIVNSINESRVKNDDKLLDEVSMRLDEYWHMKSR